MRTPPKASPWMISRVIRDTTALGLAATILLPSVSAQDIINSTSKEKPKSAFPTLSILPEGSILRHVRLPRYNKDFKPTSLLVAEQLTILDKNRIKGDRVTIELYQVENGSLQARSKMRRAIYNQQESTLHAREEISLQGNNYVATGSGLIFHWESKQGFLDGPVSTQFTYQKKNTAMNIPQKAGSRHKLSSLARGTMLGTYLTVSTSANATPPAGLSANDLKELDRLSQPTVNTTVTNQKDVETIIRQQDALSKQANQRITPFLKSIDKDVLLIQSPTESAPSLRTKPTHSSTPAKPVLKPGESTLLVECDGGLYFDNDAGLLVYLKNIRLTEDRFKLTCSDELKVFLSQEKQDDTKTKDDAKDQLSSFGQLKRIIATGDVKVTRLDDQGRPFVAMAETASYQAATGELILRGGRPKLQQSANQYLEAQEPNQWVKVLQNGKLVTSSGKWKMVTILNNR